MSTIDYDCYGKCCICHKDMLIEEVIDSKLQKRFTSEYTEKSFKLNDDSIMRVALCVGCSSSITEKDYKNIMDCIIKGWDKETDELVKSPLFPHWTQEKKDFYMQEYSKKEIVEDI